MSGDTDIRQAKPEDINVLATLAAQTFTDNFGHLYKADALQTHLEKTCSEQFFLESLVQGDALLLAYYKGNLAGYAKAGKLDLPVESLPASAGGLHRLYVTEPYHGKGIGKALVESLLQCPVLKASQNIYLGVWEHNHRAQRFYARYGFIPVGEYQYRVGEHSDREIIMRREQAL